MKVFFTCLLLLSISVCATAQTSGTLKGKIIDTVGKQSLKGATVTILNPVDSTLELFGATKDDGTFELKGISFGSYLVSISFLGYETVYKRLAVSKVVADANFGNIYLKTKANDLTPVTVTQSPIRILHDTIEYNASSFKTKPNAVVEDLLKKLPGVDVDKNGGIKAQGETVQRVLVDNKRFFGDDPKMATKNLPPDIVDKIQIFDDLSDQSKFTGFDDGNRVKTINITTKKDKRKGYFGKAVAGVGTAETYDENFNIHRLNGNSQISLVGQGNDINKQNFTAQDFLGGGGGARGGGGGGGGRGGGGGGSTGSGITTTWAAGLNYRDTWGKNADISGSYFYNNQHTVTDQQSLTQNLITADSSTYNNSGSSSVKNINNHRLNFNLEQKFDSMNSLVFRPGVSFQGSEPFSSSSTITTGGQSGKFINNSISSGNGVSSGYNITGSNLQLRHKFNKKFRTLSVDLNITANSNNGDGHNYSVNKYTYPFAKTDTLDQYYNNPSNSFTISPTVSYTEPLGKNQILEVNYNFSHLQSVSNNNTYEYNSATKAYTIFDSLFSNSYKHTSTSNRATLNYRLQNAKFNFSVGTGVQFSDQVSINTTKNVTVVHDYTNLTPTANFQYNFTKSKNIRINYTGRTGQPSIAQLQPITTTSDSINFQKGNPDLHPQFTHSLRILYQSFDPVSQRVFFVTVNASAIVNDIQSSVVQQPNGGKLTTNVNLDGTYNLSGYINYGFALRNPKSNLNFTTNINYGQSQTLINGQSDFTRQTTLGETVKWTTNLKNNFDMNFNSTTTYYIIRNSLQPTQNSDYYTQTLGAEVTYYTNNGWILAADFDYTYSGNHAAGYNTSVPLLNPSFAKQFLKDKAGELRLTVFDALNQNQSVTRSVTGNTIQDTRTNVLTRYAMLTFTYNLRQFAGKQQRMPSPFRGMRPPGGAGGGQRGGGGGGMGGGGRGRG